MNLYSTEPARNILDRLQSPDDRLKIIHIAGTNGKGSTAEFFTQILISAGKSVGTFTSPEVYNFNSQFKVNGKPLTDSRLNEYFGQAKRAAEGITASEFEIQTAGAIYAFACEGCEYAVIECGMGGLTDATNAINKKVLAIITSISLEHTAYLGDTIEKICKQKAGIIKDCPVIVNSKQLPEARRYFEKLGARFADKLPCGEMVQGSLQPYNAATAALGAEMLGIDPKAIREGIKNARPEGRLEEFFVGGAEYILDGAHNPAAFEPLADFLKDRRGAAIIFGCLSDKDMDGNLKKLTGLAERIIAVKCDSPRASDINKTEAVCRKYFKNVTVANSVTDALNNTHAPCTVVCGSFTLLKQAKEWIDGRKRNEQRKSN